MDRFGCEEQQFDLETVSGSHAITQYGESTGKFASRSVSTMDDVDSWKHFGQCTAEGSQYFDIPYQSPELLEFTGLPSIDTLSAVLAAGFPAVFRDALRHFPLMQPTKFGYRTFIEDCGGVLLTVQTVPFGDYLSSIAQGPTLVELASYVETWAPSNSTKREYGYSFNGVRVAGDTSSVFGLRVCTLHALSACDH